MYKIGICGHYGGGKNCLDGQTIKTKIITKELEKKYEIKKVDTFDGKKRLLSILIRLFILIKSCENIIILPAHNSLKIFVPFLIFFNIFFKRKLHYIVIGGWLSKYILKRKYLKKYLKKFHYIYVETSKMKSNLEKQGFRNIIILPNCKELKILPENELVYNLKKPYKLCTFSRVMKEKGIENAIEAVKSVNEQEKEIIYILDIYGQIDKNYEEIFKKIEKNLPKYTKYKGSINFSKSVEVSKNYNILLFPTLYYTEGVPGTIIDAFAAGVPIISAKWESFDDVINEKVGIGYEFNNIDELKKLLSEISKKIEMINSMKKDCLDEAEKYIPKVIIKKLEKNFY